MALPRGDPADPVRAGGTSALGWTDKVAVSGSIAVVLGPESLSTLDLSDPQAPQILGMCYIDIHPYYSQKDLAVAGAGFDKTYKVNLAGHASTADNDDAVDLAQFWNEAESAKSTRYYDQSSAWADFRSASYADQATAVATLAATIDIPWAHFQAGNPDIVNVPKDFGPLHPPLPPMPGEANGLGGLEVRQPPTLLDEEILFDLEYAGGHLVDPKDATRAVLRRQRAGDRVHE